MQVCKKEKKKKTGLSFYLHGGKTPHAPVGLARFGNMIPQRNFSVDSYKYKHYLYLFFSPSGIARTRLREKSDFKDSSETKHVEGLHGSLFYSCWPSRDDLGGYDTSNAYPFFMLSLWPLQRKHRTWQNNRTVTPEMTFAFFHSVRFWGLKRNT